MVTDVVEVVRLVLAVLLAAEDAADVRLALRARSEACRIRQHGLEELQRHDLLALELDRLDGGHADILEAAEVIEVALAERHEEADALDARDGEAEALELLVVQEVHVLRADFREVVDTLDLHRLRLDPVAVLPVAAVGRDFADVDLGVEVRRERIAVVAGVAVEDVDVVDLVEVVLERVGGEDARDARVEAGAEERRDAGLLVALAVGPLPLVLELRRVLRLVVGRVDVIRLRREAGVHDVQVLVRQREVQHDVRLEVLDQGDERIDVIRINLRRADLRLRRALELLLERVALRLRARDNHDFTEFVRVLAALVDGDTRDTTAADDQSFSHGNTS